MLRKICLSLAAIFLVGGLAYAQTIGQRSEDNVATFYTGPVAAATATTAALPIPIYQTGSFTGTVTGYAAPPTGTIEYRVAGKIVTLFITTVITGTSNATSMTLTGMPAAIRPTIDAKLVNTLVTDNAVLVNASASIATSGTVTFGMGAGFSATGFTASGAKALQDTWTLTYALD